MGRRGAIPDMAAAACVAIALMLLVMRPLAVRNDLRHDLAHLATLKTWPVRGASIVRGEVLAPALTLSATLAILLTAAMMLASRDALDAVIAPGASRIMWAIAGILAASALAVTQLVVQNGVALMFPAWSTVGDARSMVETMGQGMLVMFGSTLALVVGLLPAALAGGVAAAAAGFTGANPVLAGVFAASLVVFAECAIAVEILGRLFDRTDLNAVARSAS